MLRRQDSQNFREVSGAMQHPNYEGYAAFCIIDSNVGKARQRHEPIFDWQQFRTHSTDERMPANELRHLTDFDAEICRRRGIVFFDPAQRVKDIAPRRRR